MTKNLVKQAGRKALVIPEDLRDQEFRTKVVQQHLEAFKFIGQSRSALCFRKRC